MTWISQARWCHRGVACLLGLGLAAAQAQENVCGSLDNGYGPYDYRTDKDKLTIVEKYHFTPLVESMTKPMFTTIASDLGYTLKAFPNHHRALVTLVRDTDRLRNLQPPGAEYSADCWFERAIRFRPDDLVVRMIYAHFLTRHKRDDEALRQIDFVVAAAGADASAHLKAGLLYVPLRQFDKALAQARTVERLGGEVEPLREQLRAARRWAERATPSPEHSGQSPQPASK